MFSFLVFEQVKFRYVFRTLVYFGEGGDVEPEQDLSVEERLGDQLDLDDLIKSLLSCEAVKIICLLAEMMPLPFIMRTVTCIVVKSK